MSAGGLRLRDCRAEYIDMIDSLDSGTYLVQMATGLVETVTFANIRRLQNLAVL